MCRGESASGRARGLEDIWCTAARDGLARRANFMRSIDLCPCSRPFLRITPGFRPHSRDGSLGGSRVRLAIPNVLLAFGARLERSERVGPCRGSSTGGGGGRLGVDWSRIGSQWLAVCIDPDCCRHRNSVGNTDRSLPIATELEVSTICQDSCQWQGQD